MTMASILREKGRQVVHVAPTAPATDILETLARHQVGAVLVLDAARQVLGIVSERDLVRSLVRHGTVALGMSAAQLMTSDLITANLATTVPEALRLMTDGRFRHLPVMDQDVLCGVVSIGDVVKTRISEQADEVETLKAYVSGTV